MALVAAVIIAAGIGLNALRLSVGGVRNLVSPSYWGERYSGHDLYQPVGRILKHGNRNFAEIALTFDDGPHPESLPTILRILAQEQLKATFFLVGKRINEHPELAREILQRGHEVGNHSQNHFRLTDLPDAKIVAEIEQCATAFQNATGKRFHLLRPPGMRFDEHVLKITQDLDYQIVGWTNAAKDFDSTDNRLGKVTPIELADRVTTRVHDGSIILLHDTPQTTQAIELIIARLKGQGFSFVTVSEMLAHLPNPVVVEANPAAPPPSKNPATSTNPQENSSSRH
ncbi:MAG: polysaccharide deacetylase family protein [Fimbriimonadaceae bacterium]